MLCKKGSVRVGVGQCMTGCVCGTVYDRVCVWDSSV